jgi:hypothetical protein
LYLEFRQFSATAPKSIESKTIRPAEHQNSTNQQTLVPVQVPGGNLCFQMSAPGGINNYPSKLLFVYHYENLIFRGPSESTKHSDSIKADKYTTCASEADSTKIAHDE